MKSRNKFIIYAVFVLISVVFMLGMKPQERGGAIIKTIVLSPGNTAPIAKNMEITTYRGAAVSGKLEAFDAENENITFKVSKKPKYGEVTINEDGTFVYNPMDTKASKDRFEYIAEDTSENKSESAEVIIKIDKKKGQVEYIDMDGDGGEYASIYLTEQGIYTGRCVGGEYFFSPDKTVSKGEFLSMCLKATGHEMLHDVTTTGLINDKELPVWIKNVVSTAVLCGCFTGDEVFNYGEEITWEDAVIMLDAVFNITDVATVSSIAPYYREASAQAMNNLYFCDIVDESAVSNLDNALTLREAALMLTKAVNVYNNR